MLECFLEILATAILITKSWYHRRQILGLRQRWFIVAWAVWPWTGTLNKENPGPLYPHLVHKIFISAPTCTSWSTGNLWSGFFQHLIGVFIHVHMGRPLTALIFWLGAALGPSFALLGNKVTAFIWMYLVFLCFLPCWASHADKGDSFQAHL